MRGDGWHKERMTVAYYLLSRFTIPTSENEARVFLGATVYHRNPPVHELAPGEVLNCYEWPDMSEYTPADLVNTAPVGINQRWP